jgi:hypothetical protein
VTHSPSNLTSRSLWRRSHALLWLCIVTLIFPALAANAQEFRGTITGKVSDQRGAVLAECRRCRRSGSVTLNDVAREADERARIPSRAKFV